MIASKLPLSRHDGNRQPAAGNRFRAHGLRTSHGPQHSRMPVAGCRLPLIGFVALVLHFAAPALAQRGLDEPEAATGATSKSLAVASRHMISAAHPLAAEAGREMLRAGGSAVDAAIAAQLVLGLVEPQSSGLGGGAFLLAWDNTANKLTSYDGRETAPAAATPDRFLRDGKPMAFDTAVKSGLSIATPGLVRLLEHTHKKHGRLPWATLFAPALRLADDGFEMPDRLHRLLESEGAGRFAPDARAYFFEPDGRAVAAGTRLRNPGYATTLRAISEKGAEAFYSGAIADAIVAAARAAPTAAGDLAPGDLTSYGVVEREPVCVAYRTRKVCGMGPPSSGGVAVGQILTLLQPFDLGKPPATAFSAEAMHLIAEAEKLAYADRGRYLADPAFVAVPDGLLDSAYLAKRRTLIDSLRAMAKPAPGEPPGLKRRAFGIDATLERAGTTHLSVIDADGNAVAMTSTIEGAFGSGVWAAGFLLNNEMTDFSFLPTDPAGAPVANRIEPGKRPRSTMSPTIVFDETGEVEAVLGSPGGGRIIYYVVKTLAGLIDLGLDPQAAAALPNFGSSGGAVDIELSWDALPGALRLLRLGHTINADALTSGLHIAARRNGRLEGGADPRREGVALGD